MLDDRRATARTSACCSELQFAGLLPKPLGSKRAVGAARGVSVALGSVIALAEPIFNLSENWPAAVLLAEALEARSRPGR